MVTVTDWESFKEALEKDVDRTQTDSYLERMRKKQPDHADHCERLLFHNYNGRRKWKLSLDLANSSVKGDQARRSRLERLKQLMEVWGDQTHPVYTQVVNAFKA